MKLLDDAKLDTVKQSLKSMIELNDGPKLLYKI